MCYYNGLRVTKTEFIRLKALEKELKFLRDIPVRSGFDYSDWPIIKPLGNSDVEITMAHWEFIPGMVRSKGGLPEFRKRYATLNAKGETLLTSKFYRDAALHRRCLVLSSGFYDWRHYRPEGAKKELTYPYYIKVADEQEYFFMAGIWQPWTDRETGETMDTFALVTAPANELMSQIHNSKLRMPTILTEDLAHEWLQDGLTEERITEIATFQYDSDEMGAYTIRRDFRTTADPCEAFEYVELPGLL